VSSVFQLGKQGEGVLVAFVCNSFNAFEKVKKRNPRHGQAVYLGFQILKKPL
jgi:hypothetical protein